MNATEQNSTHTAGPWEAVGGRVFPVSKGALKPVGPVPDGIGGSGNMFLIANVFAPERSRDGNAVATLEANARLIAAAPELLAALNQCLRGLEILSAATPAHKGLKQDINLVRAVIAKAEGRQP